MLYAWVGDEKRAPVAKGERTTCRDCGNLLTAVMPVENTPHWRHKSGDCDSWSEPEGAWHLGWKEMFDVSCREIGLRDELTGELHRADVLVGSGTPMATVLELQHSSISEDERNAREAFYRRQRRMFWLVHLQDESSFLKTNFLLSLGLIRRVVNLDGKKFMIRRWAGRSHQFIEKWKRASGHVFFNLGPHVFYLAGPGVASRFEIPLQRGEFAVCALTRDEFVRAVRGEKIPSA